MITPLTNDRASQGLWAAMALLSAGIAIYAYRYFLSVGAARAAARQRLRLAFPLCAHHRRGDGAADSGR